MSGHSTTSVWFLGGIICILSACTHHFSSAQVPHQASLSTTSISPSSSHPHTNIATLPLTTEGSKGWQHENLPLSADKTDFMVETAQRYHIPIAFVAQFLSTAQLNTQVLRLMRPQSGAHIKRHWATYRHRFVEPIRIRKGTAFWNKYRQALAEAERIYGIPAAVIAAIIGVETVYGEQMGTFSIRDALYTLGFYYPDPYRPDKAQIFRNQLAALIALTYKGQLNGDQAIGSFAGAYGMGQFMPISILHYAVDADHNGLIELDRSPQDAIHSIANFLLKHGWQTDMPIFAPANLPLNPNQLVMGGLEANMSWDQLKNKGASTAITHAKWQNGIRLGVINLQDDIYGKTEYRIATQNFFAITKYNRSYFYATAVADLASKLAEQQIANGYTVIKP